MLLGTHESPGFPSNTVIDVKAVGAYLVLPVMSLIEFICFASQGTTVDCK